MSERDPMSGDGRRDHNRHDRHTTPALPQNHTHACTHPAKLSTGGLKDANGDSKELEKFRLDLSVVV